MNRNKQSRLSCITLTLLILTIASAAFADLPGPRDPLSFRDMGLYGGWNNYWFRDDSPFNFFVVQAWVESDGRVLCHGMDKNTTWNDWLKIARAKGFRVIAVVGPRDWKSASDKSAAFKAGIDRFMKAVDEEHLYAITLAEEGIYWDGHHQVYRDAYDYVKKTYDVPAWQWYSPYAGAPGFGWPHLPADGWMVDEYARTGPSYETFIRSYIINQLPLVQIVWAAPLMKSFDWEAKGDAAFDWQVEIGRKYNVPTLFFAWEGHENVWGWSKEAQPKSREVYDRAVMWANRVRTTNLKPFEETWDTIPSLQPQRIAPTAEGRLIFDQDFMRGGCLAASGAVIRGFRDVRWDGGPLELRPRKRGAAYAELLYPLKFESPSNDFTVSVVGSFDRELGGAITVSASTDGVNWSSPKSVPSSGRLRFSLSEDYEFKQADTLQLRVILSGKANEVGDTPAALESIGIEGKNAVSVDGKDEKAMQSDAMGQSDSGLSVDHAVLTEDRYPIPIDEWQWGEGWGDFRQYFPRYFKEGATLHAFLRNDGIKPIEVNRLLYNGRSIDEVCTSPDYAGPVIWHRVNPEAIQPGEMGMVYVRLRSKPERSIELTVASEDGDSAIVRLAPSDTERIRLGDVGFNASRDKIYVYVDKFTEEDLTVSEILVDGKDLTSKARITNRGFADGDAALLEVDLPEPFAYGSYHCIKVCTKEGVAAMHQVKARDDFYPLSMIQGQTPLSEYHAKFFNSLYHLHGLHPDEPGWWDKSSEMAKLGFKVTKQAPREDIVRAGATTPPGRIRYTNVDEPDAHEPGPLPYMDRCGINVMRQLEPVMKMQRKLDPNHETTVIVDRTYAPRNWLDYGEVPDVLINDIYTPTQWHSVDLGVIPTTVDALKYACGPRPVEVMLFGCMNSGHEVKRSPTPQENDMSVHYVIGSGAKGLHYFLDWNSYPTVFEGGYYIGAPGTNMLWKNMGRMNAEISRIGSLLSIGHPFDVVSSDNQKLWARSLLCGRDNIIVVLVNTKHNIPSEVAFRGSAWPHVFPVKDSNVTINLPSWFNLKKAVAVSWNEVTPVELSGKGRKRELKVDELYTSQVLVLSQDADIEKKLTLNPSQLQALIDSEKPIYVSDTPPIEDVVRNTVVTLDAAAIESSGITLDLTDPAVISLARSIKTEGDLKLEAGKWLGLMTRPDWHGESEIIFKIESDAPFKSVNASLVSQTPNMAARAHNIIGLSFDGKSYVETSSLNAAWNGGASGESLAASAENDENARVFYVRIIMRDPGIVASDDATNLVQKIELSWER